MENMGELADQRMGGGSSIVVVDRENSSSNSVVSSGAAVAASSQSSVESRRVVSVVGVVACSSSPPSQASALGNHVLVSGSQHATRLSLGRVVVPTSHGSSQLVEVVVDVSDKLTDNVIRTCHSVSRRAESRELLDAHERAHSPHHDHDNVHDHHHDDEQDEDVDDVGQARTLDDDDEPVDASSVMIDAGDIRGVFSEPTYQTLNGRMTPPGFPTSSSYATLTPLQPLPPISKLSLARVLGAGPQTHVVTTHEVRVFTSDFIYLFAPKYTSTCVLCSGLTLRADKLASQVVHLFISFRHNE